MTEVVFYDMPQEERYNWVARLVEQAWRAKKRMLIHCGSDTETRYLDEFLWTYREDAFLPHEVVGKDGTLADGDAQVVLTTQEQDPIDAEILLLDAPVSMAFAAQYKTVLELVDHSDQDTLQESRNRYKAWRESGANVSYKKK